MDKIATNINAEFVIALGFTAFFPVILLSIEGYECKAIISTTLEWLRKLILDLKKHLRPFTPLLPFRRTGMS